MKSEPGLRVVTFDPQHKRRTFADDKRLFVEAVSDDGERDRCGCGVTIKADGTSECSAALRLLGPFDHFVRESCDFLFKHAKDLLDWIPRLRFGYSVGTISGQGKCCDCYKITPELMLYAREGGCSCCTNCIKSKGWVNLFTVPSLKQS